MYDLPDPAFLGAAYLRLLGRPADPAGFARYLGLLESGRLTRAQVAQALQSSDEGAQARGHAPAQAERLAVLWPQRPRVPRGRIARNAKQVLALHGAPFVECAYAWCAGRPPTADELAAALPADTEAARRATLARLRAAYRWPWQRRAGPDAARPAAAASGSAHAPAFPPAPTPSPLLAAPAPAPAAAGHAPARGGTGLFTIASRSYRPYVDTLMASVRQHHPELRLYLLLVDEPAPGDPPADDLYETVPAAGIGVPCFEDMTMRYDVMELSTALKPWFLRWLFEHTALESLVYLDPDIRLYAPLQPVLELLAAGHTAVLTPHVTQPLDDRGEPGDHAILQSGVFNLGFAAFRRSTESLAYAAWWAERVRTGALVDFAHNLFTDQRWCDCAPAFMPGLAVLRDPGCNVAYWNLAHRDVRPGDDGGWRVGGVPLRFFHFSGIVPDDARVLSRHQSRFGPGEPAALQPLLEAYRAELLRRGWAAWRRERCAYDTVQGVPLPPLARALYRQVHPDPAPVTRGQALAELLRQSRVTATGAEAPGASITPLMQLIHGLRPDVARQYDLSTPEGRRGCAFWLLAAGAAEHGLVDFLQAAAAA